MRKAYVIRPVGTEQTAIRVKLTAYKPTRPVTLERFRGMPTMISLAMQLNQRYAAYGL